MSVMLRAEQITYQRYYQPVFQPVSFTLAEGDALLLKGRNGAGKTTLLRLITGALQPSQGELQLTAPFTWVGHKTGLKEALTVVENLTFQARFLGLGEGSAGGLAHRLQHVINTMALETVAQQEVRTLSAGQRRRCALARLALCSHPLWLLDEPYSNLDVEGIALVNRLLAAHMQNGGAAVIASHGDSVTAAHRVLQITAADGQVQEDE